MADSAEASNQVRLVDLEIIKRYSLAVRQESAPADDLLEALDASRETVLSALGLPVSRRRERARNQPSEE